MFVNAPFLSPSSPLPPVSFLFSLFLFISGWIRVTDDCAVCVGSSQGRVKGGGKAHSQTRLEENGKPFRLSLIFCTRFLLPCPCSLPDRCVFPPSLLWPPSTTPLFSPSFPSQSPNGHHPHYTKSSVISLTAHSLPTQAFFSVWWWPHTWILSMIYIAHNEGFGHFRCWWR